MLVPLLLLAGCADSAMTSIPNRPKLPGTLRLSLRARTVDGPKGTPVRVTERVAEWKVAETAVIVCDMWDDHYCKCAAQRVGVMVPRMNAVLSAARDHGVQIVHAPSGTVDLYADTPFRQRLKLAKPAEPPFSVNGWCHLDPDREPPLPVDTTRSACDDPIPGAVVRKYTRQHPGLDMVGYDGVSDSGPEVYSFFVQEGIKNVAVMGVHTNMCVLGRPFGIRQLVRLGFNVVLVRDLTDAMYDPRQPPYVSHARGTELVVEHVERYWCPTVLGDDLTRLVPGSAGPTE
jgi:nicotinamidase-related amidase